MDYQDRKLADVAVYGVMAQVIGSGPSAGGDGVSAHVSFQLTGSDGGKYGPEIEVKLAFPAEHSLSMADLEAAAVEAAKAVVDRIAGEGLADLQAKRIERREEARSDAKKEGGRIALDKA